jgi:C4-dicarboxylate transporter DctM subunit
MAISLVTTPVGTRIFVASGVGKVDVGTLVPSVLKFFVPMVIIQFMITYIPFITTFLPSFMD